MKTLLIDGDIVAYQIAAALETAINWGDDLWTLHADAGEGKYRVDNFIETLLEKLNATAVVIALTDVQNFRKTIYPEYKSNRADIRRPMILQELKNHMMEHHHTFLRPWLEADDVLGILATSPVLVRGDKIICSIDKDLHSIPGVHYNWRKEETIEVSEKDADRFHMIQTLTGDPTDGYPGCKGVGGVTATKILDGLNTYAEMWPVVLETYRKKGMEGLALPMAQIARICRRDDYNFKEKVVIPWTPPRS